MLQKLACLKKPVSVKNGSGKSRILAAIVRENPELQTHSVFIRLFSILSIESVKAKIAGELKNRPGNGFFICYFEHIGELHRWPFEELRTLIRK